MGKIPSPSLKDELLLICLFEQIISASISVIPEQIIRSCRLAERSFIIALYLLFSAIYSTSTIAWFATRLQKISLYRWYIYTLAIIIFWALLGVTHAELFLFFLPLSISIGICLYSICSRLFVIPPSDKRCGEDQDWHEKINCLYDLKLLFPKDGIASLMKICKWTPKVAIEKIARQILQMALNPMPFVSMSVTSRY